MKLCEIIFQVGNEELEWEIGKTLSKLSKMPRSFPLAH